MLLQHQCAEVIQTRNAASLETSTTPATTRLFLLGQITELSDMNGNTLGNHIVTVSVQSTEKF